MRVTQRFLIHGAAALVLCAAAITHAHAQPANPPGQQGQGPGHEIPPGQQGRGQAGEPRRSYRGGDDWQPGERRDRNGYAQGPRIDEREIRRLLRERRDWVQIDRSLESLPPGIRKNLARGKPLPPGIAKQLDERILRYLPRYDGYEWRRVGPDVILVEAANAIIYAVLRDIFY